MNALSTHVFVLDVCVNVYLISYMCVCVFENAPQISTLCPLSKIMAPWNMKMALVPF